ncbi:MAG: NifU N-terminal domain-containing protein, partial [Thermaurantiacus sp.]
MLIETERTPNPDTLKFLPDRPVSPGAPRDFATPEDGETSPLARALFSLGDVERVFLGEDFVTVTRAPGAADWAELTPRLLEVMVDVFASGQPVAGEARGDD